MKVSILISLSILILSLCFSSVNCEDQIGLLLYGSRSLKTPNGFGFYNGTFTPFSNQPLKKTLTSFKLASYSITGSTVDGPNYLIAFGDIEFYGDTPVGGMLKVDTNTHRVNNVGSGIYSTDLSFAHVGAQIDGQYNVVVVGSNLSLPINQFTNLGNVATCSIGLNDQGSCQGLGNGLPNYNDYPLGLASINADVFVAYKDINDNLVVYTWVFDQSKWNLIFEVTPRSFPTRGSNILAAYGETLFIGGDFDVPKDVQCSKSENLTNFAYFTSTCWSGIKTPLELPSVDAIGLDIYNGHVAMISPSGPQGIRSVVYFNGTISQKITSNLNLICNLGIGNSLSAYNGTVYIQCGSMMGLLDNGILNFTRTSGIAMYIPSFGEWRLINQTFCFSTEPVNFVLRDGNLWYDCKQYDGTVTMMKFDPQNNSNFTLTLNNLYGEPQEIEAMCSFNDKLFVVGDFVIAGGISTPKNTAIWNGTQWNSISLLNFPLLSDCDSCVTCASDPDSDDLIVAYQKELLDDSKVTYVVLAWIRYDTLSVFYSEPYKIEEEDVSIIHLTVVQSRYVYLTTNVTLPLVYDIKNGTWEEISWECDFIGPVNIWNVVANGSDIFILGNFVMISDGITYTSIAKYNLETQSFLSVGSFFYQNTIGMVTSLLITNSSQVDPAYVGGQFSRSTSSNMNNIAGGDGTYWFDTMSNGILGGIVCDLRFDPILDNIYILWHPQSCQKPLIEPYLTVFVYNEKTGILSLAQGVQAADIINQYQPPDFPLADTDSKRSVHIIFIVLGAVGLFLLIVSVVGGLFIRWKRNRANRYIEIPDYNDDNLIENFEDVFLTDSAINKIEESEVELGRHLGAGGFGSVYYARYRNEEVAAKSIDVMEQENVVSFLKEIKLLSSVKHKNIVEFIGVMFSVNNKRIWLITELMDTDLKKAMLTLKKNQKWRIAKDIANAMEYLHSFKPPVLYRDLKPSNVLLNKQGRAKLTDFGISRLKPQTTTMVTQFAGTLCYIAPEVLMEARYTEKVDVYSYGILLSELMSGVNPFHRVQFGWSFQFIDQFKSNSVTLDLPRPPSFDESLCAIVERCTSWNPVNRPTFPEIVEYLKKNQNVFEK